MRVSAAFFPTHTHIHTHIESPLPSLIITVSISSFIHSPGNLTHVLHRLTHNISPSLLCSLFILACLLLSPSPSQPHLFLTSSFLSLLIPSLTFPSRYYTLPLSFPSSLSLSVSSSSPALLPSSLIPHRIFLHTFISFLPSTLILFSTLLQFFYLSLSLPSLFRSRSYRFPVSHVLLYFKFSLHLFQLLFIFILLFLYLYHSFLFSLRFSSLLTSTPFISLSL